ncbi:hypothetical protein ACFFX0_17275 [Citricoccus parietis]|uniref:Uncharacterized protein n=1 Tax=Citricoccus parietis TaxID=592307 RepID=A0ABV5G1R6_9MICC
MPIRTWPPRLPPFRGRLPPPAPLQPPRLPASPRAPPPWTPWMPPRRRSRGFPPRSPQSDADPAPGCRLKQKGPGHHWCPGPFSRWRQGDSNP